MTTVGVKIEKKMVSVGAAEVALILWDIAGEDDVTGIRTSYLRGSAGYLLIVDVTRGETLEVAKSIQARMTSEIGSVPFLFLFNKTDLKEQWDLPEQSVEDLENAGHVVLRTSAKTGEGVEEAFQTLAQRMVL